MKKIYLSLLGFALCWGMSAQVSVTLNVDMNSANPTSTLLNVVGNFNDPDYDGTVYPTDYNADYQNWTLNTIMLTDPDLDGVFSVTLTLSPARYEFKFIDGDGWDFAENVPTACTVEVSGNSNRQIMVGSNNDETYSVCYAKCVACGENAVRFRVDVSTVDIDGDGIFGEPEEDIHPAGIHIAGDFQGIWDPSTLALQDWNGDKVWETTLPVGTATSVMFKFINGDSWDFPNENIVGTCGDGGGNRLEAITSDNTVLSAYCWNSCESCTLPVAVTFQVDMTASCLDTSPGVFLMGTATDWSNGTALTDLDLDGVFELTLNIGAGSYEYKFRVGTDGWEGIGNRQLVVVADTPVTLPAVCFGSADPCSGTVDPGDVTFQARPGTNVIPNGQSMWIMGDFTSPSWQVGALVMTDTDGDGTWSVTVPQVCQSNLKYKFAIGLDNTVTTTDWLEESADFSAIGGCGVDNGTFSDNRELIRTSGDPITVCYTFDTCTSCLVGVDENEVVANLSVFPIPANDVMYVNFTSSVAQRINIKMLNAMGQTVLEENPGVVTGQRIVSLNTSALASGIYYLAISNGTTLQSKTVSVK